MKEKQVAAGGVVVKVADGQVGVLLIRDGYGHWTWAKGHVESGETVEECAVREIGEETGLKNIHVLEKLGEQEYDFVFEEEEISKIVHIFLVEAKGDEKLVAQTSEIQCAQWFSSEEALEKIEYEGSRVLLEKGINVFRMKTGLG